MAALEPNMHQSPKMIAVKISKMDNHLEKIHFADLVKDAKSVPGFSSSRKFQVGRNDITYMCNHSLAAKNSFKMAAFEVEI